MTDGSIPTHEQLRDMVPHVVYEWQMLHATAAALSGSHPEPVRNALIEAFLLHARQLVDFFTGGGTQNPDNCYARHYCVSWTEPKVEGPLLEARTAVNKYVGHLTTVRLTAREWRVGAIVAALQAIAVRFKAAATPDLFPVAQLDVELHGRVLVAGTTTTTGLTEVVVLAPARKL